MIRRQSVLKVVNQHKDHQVGQSRTAGLRDYSSGVWSWLMVPLSNDSKSHPSHTFHTIVPAVSLACALWIGAFSRLDLFWFWASFIETPCTIALLPLSQAVTQAYKHPLLANLCVLAFVGRNACHCFGWVLVLSSSCFPCLCGLALICFCSFHQALEESRIQLTLGAISNHGSCALCLRQGYMHRYKEWCICL